MAQKTGIGIFLASAFLGVLILFYMAGTEDSNNVDIAYRDFLEKEAVGETVQGGKADDSGSILNSESKGKNRIPESTVPIQKDSSEEEVIDGEQSMVCAYVCGKVKNPGVYKLAKGARLSDFINAAGGFSKRAAQEYLNLAEKTEDGQRIYVPSQKEAKRRGLELEETPAENQNGSSMENGKVNINTAGKEELMTLAGIGEAKADAIISYREEHGGFGTIEELMQISGIKEGIYQKISDSITT